MASFLSSLDAFAPHMLARVLAYLGEFVLGRVISSDAAYALLGLPHHFVATLIPCLPGRAEPLLFALHDRRTWHVEVIALVHLLTVEVEAAAGQAARDAMTGGAKITFTVIGHSVTPSLDRDLCERHPIRTTGQA
jgi:hypothetical protein